MAKLLISFLGTGRSSQQGNSAIREYSLAKYSVEGEIAGESSFVSSVLMEHYNYDGLLLIGTAKSMWEEVYRYYSEKQGLTIDEDYYLELAVAIESATHATDVDAIDLGLVRKVLGENSNAIIISYGLNKEEQLEIFKRLGELFKTLEKDDEVALDITHAFRSLPLIAMSMINYFHSLTDKQVSFNHIYYGMLEAMREFNNVAPIVDVSTSLELQKWTTAAYAFKEYGKGAMLADLLGGEEGKMIEIFSDTVNLNYLSEIQQRLTNFRDSASKGFDNEFAQWVVPQVLSSFTKRLFKAGNKQYIFQYELSVWHKEKQNYASAYIVLAESIVTYLCSMAGVAWLEKDNREAAKAFIQNYHDPKKDKSFYLDLSLDVQEELRKHYKKINDIRNNIAHNLSRRSNKAQADINYLEAVQNDIYKIIKNNPVK